MDNLDMDNSKSFNKFTFNVLFIGAIIILIVNITALLKLVVSSEDKEIFIIKVPSVERPEKTVPKVRLPNTPVYDPKVTPARDPSSVLSRSESSKYTFKEDWFSGRIPVFKKVLEKYKGLPNIQYLEVGVFEGFSLLWVLTNILTDPSSKITAIDLFNGSRKQRYFGNIQASGRKAQIETIIGASQIELRKLPINTFDIIYIDGSHSAGDVLEDAILAMRLLKAGGLLIFDDYGFEDQHYRMKVATAVDTFYQFYHHKFKVIQRGWLVILEKTTANKH